MFSRIRQQLMALQRLERVSIIPSMKTILFFWILFSSFIPLNRFNTFYAFVSTKILRLYLMVLIVIWVSSGFYPVADQLSSASLILRPSSFINFPIAIIELLQTSQLFLSTLYFCQFPYKGAMQRRQQSANRLLRVNPDLILFSFGISLQTSKQPLNILFIFPIIFYSEAALSSFEGTPRIRLSSL